MITAKPIEFIHQLLVIKRFAQSEMKPTGPSRAGGRNLEQTPTLVVVLVVFGGGRGRCTKTDGDLGTFEKFSNHLH